MYGIKYRTAYRRTSDKLTTIDILKKDYVGAITDLEPTDSPFTITSNGDIGNIYYPTIGSGATISVYATPLTLLELFTDDPQLFKVKAYDGESGTNLFWQGFVTAEIYSENYSYSSQLATPITISCTDGMRLLENIKYKTSLDAFYLGNVTLKQVFANILAKLNLSFTNIYTSNDIIIDDGGAGLTNPFLNIKVTQENYIDESEEAMSCRDVLNSIFGSLGLVMRFRADRIYIIDPINLHDAGKGRVYNTATYSDDGPVSLGGYLDISQDQIKWFETDAQLDMHPSVSEVIVKYDPYNYNKGIYDFSDLANLSDVGSWVDMDSYYVNTDVVYDGWTFTGTDYMSVGVKELETASPEYVLYLTDSHTVAKYTFPYSNITQDENQVLKVSMDVYVQTKLDSVNIYSDENNKDVYSINIPISIKVGNQYYKGVNSWATGATGNYRQPLTVREENIGLMAYTKSRINNKWTSASMFIPLKESIEGNLLSGNISIEILDNLTTQPDFDIIFGSHQFEPWTEPCFNITSPAGNYTHNGTTIAVEKSNNDSVRITIQGFSNIIGIPIDRTLFDGAVLDIDSTRALADVIGGIWIDNLGHQHGYGSDLAHTYFTPISYVASSDTLTFNVVTSGTPYFTDNYNHIDTCIMTEFIFNYDYKSAVVLIKNIKIEIVDANTHVNIGNDGVEEKGINSINLTGKSNLPINCQHGIGTFGASRGSFKSITPGTNITGLYREGDETTYSAAKLLIQSVGSQYHSSRIKLSGVLDVKDFMLGVDLKLIQDSNYLPEKSFYIVGSTYNDRDESSQVEMIELVATRDNIS
jgi:hypothetical protein